MTHYLGEPYLSETGQVDRERENQQRECLVAAQDHMESEFYEWLLGEELVPLPPGEVRAFLVQALTASGWEEDACPEVVFDVAPTDDLRGWYDGETDTIHLDPRCCYPWTVLHELAHALRPTARHGPQFAAVLVTLVAHSHDQGRTAGTWLLDEFSRDGVVVDLSWVDLGDGPLVTTL